MWARTKWCPHFHIPVSISEDHRTTFTEKRLHNRLSAGRFVGQIRNDTPYTIEDIEVVVNAAYPGYTSATVNSSTLAPGETTSYATGSFILIGFYFYPWDDEEWGTVWAQGAVAP